MLYQIEHHVHYQAIQKLIQEYVKTIIARSGFQLLEIHINRSVSSKEKIHSTDEEQVEQTKQIFRTSPKGVQLHHGLKQLLLSNILASDSISSETAKAQVRQIVYKIH